MKGGSLCLDHVIWTGRQILQLVLKFDCLFTFLVFAVSKNVLKLISQEQSKHTATKIFKIQQKFHHSTICPNDMIGTLVLIEFLQ